jgi:hypothetical protein
VAEGKKQQDWLTENKEVAGFLAGLGAIMGGAAMLLDDVKDFGKPVCEGCKAIPNTPHPHHWLLGSLTLLSGIAATCASGLALLKKLPKPKAVERLPPSLLEGAPAEVLEKFK